MSESDPPAFWLAVAAMIAVALAFVLPRFVSRKSVQEAWARGLADPANPFDEPLESLWVEGWVFYANSIRYASAMTGAPDYATFKNGWWNLNRSVDLLARELKGAAGTQGPRPREAESGAGRSEGARPTDSGAPSPGR